MPKIIGKIIEAKRKLNEILINEDLEHDQCNTILKYALSTSNGMCNMVFPPNTLLTYGMIQWGPPHEFEKISIPFKSSVPPTIL